MAGGLVALGSRVAGVGSGCIVLKVRRLKRVRCDGRYVGAGTSQMWIGEVARNYLDVAVADMRARNVKPRHSRAKLLMVRTDGTAERGWPATAAAGVLTDVPACLTDIPFVLSQALPVLGTGGGGVSLEVTLVPPQRVWLTIAS